MKHTQYFNDFLADNVNLNQSRLDRLERHVGAIATFLKNEKNELTGYRKYSPQGSYAHKTVIKPVKDDDEFDADIMVFIKDDGFNIYRFTDYVSRVYSVLKSNKNYADKITKETRCVTIDYAGDFHLDIVPCIENNDSYYICNRKYKRYEQTDGDGYKEWLLRKNQIVGGNNFIKAIRLFKYLRDHKDNFTVKSILLTTILGNRINPNESDSNSKSFSDLPETLKILSNRVNYFLQSNDFMPTIRNPILHVEDFNRHWDQKRYTNFREKFNVYNSRINEAYAEKNHNESVEKWRKLFGKDFGKLQQSNKTGGVAGGIGVVDATKPYAHNS